VHQIMREPRFAGRLPIFIGDDVTDEDGIAAAEALGGMGYRVPDDFPEPEAVRAWLTSLLADAHGPTA
jgi:trehalose 6-phosphate phosphatase